MKCSIRYYRREADTVSGEQLEIVCRYSTFNKKEMDAFEEIVKKTIGLAVVTEFEVNKPED